MHGTVDTNNLYYSLISCFYFFFDYSSGAVASGFLVLIAGYSLNVTVVVVCMSLAGMTTSLAYPAYTVNMLDIAPRYASIIMGVCNTIGTTAGFVSPTIVGFMTQHKVGTSLTSSLVNSYWSASCQLGILNSVMLNFNYLCLKSMLGPTSILCYTQ